MHGQPGHQKNRVERKYPFSVLEKFGVCPTFISWINLLYFDLHCRTCQGYLLNLLLFDIAIETLLCSGTESRSQASGWGTLNISLYAYDLLFYISIPNLSLQTYELNFSEFN